MNEYERKAWALILCVGFIMSFVAFLVMPVPEVTNLFDWIGKQIKKIPVRVWFYSGLIILIVSIAKLAEWL